VNKKSLSAKHRQIYRWFVLYLKAGLLTALTVAFLIHPANADEVITKNGSRLIGTVVSMESNKLVFETSFAGKITIDWEQVARLTTENPVEVSLVGKQVLKGKVIKSDNGSLVLQPEEGQATAPISMAEVKTLKPPKPPESWEFDGRISLSASSEEGNTEKDKFKIDGDMQLYKYPHRFKTYFEGSLEKNFNITTEEKGLFTLSYDRFLTDKWYAFGKVGTERDDFADLSHLVTLGAGPGYQFWQSDEKNLSIEVGSGYVFEKYSVAQESLGGQDHREYAAAVWAMSFDMYLFNRKIQPFHNNLGSISLEDSSVWRLRTRTGVRVPLVWKFFSTVQYNYDWVNSPADGKKEYDEAILFKLGCSW